MVPTSELWRLAESEQLYITWADMDDDGLYVNHPDLPMPYILLRQGLGHNERALRVVLAHELGHYFCGESGLFVAAERLQRQYISVDEYRARKWAVQFLVPWGEFSELAASYSLAELADIFYVTEDFVHFQFEELRRIQDEQADAMLRIAMSEREAYDDLTRSDIPRASLQPIRY